MSAPGEKATLKVWRDKSSSQVVVKLGNADGADKTMADAKDAAPEGGQLGLSLRPLTRDERRESQLDGGMVIEDVAGAAARAGIQPGDVLLAINGKPVQSIDQVKGVMSGKPKNVALLVQRDGEKIFVPVNLAAVG